MNWIYATNLVLSNLPGLNLPVITGKIVVKDRTNQPSTFGG
jgi:hypothetical protein